MTDARQFVSSREEISTYLLEVEAAKYRDICSQYKYMRKIRGDGNCFYRALCFGHLESLLQNDRALQRFKETVIQSGRELLSAGFDESSFKDLLDMFLGVLEQCEADEHGDTLLQLFNEQTTSDSMVQYLRLLTSAYLQNHADFFSHFVEAPSLKVYCTQEVETMAMECDHVDILALSEALGVSIHIASVEGETDSVWPTTPFQREPSPPYTSSTKQPTMTFSTHIIAIEGPDKGLHLSQVYR